MTVPDAPTEFQCGHPDCGRMFSSQRGLSRHARTHEAPAGAFDEVLTVLDVLLPGGVPARHLPAAATWVTSTRAFLQEVRS